MYTFTLGGKTIDVFPGEVPDAPVIYLNTFSGEGRKIYDAVRCAGCPPFSLAAVSGLDWDRDLSPWDSPAVFKNSSDFTGGADDYLGFLVGDIIPETELHLPGIPLWRGIAGYSLAGLFALYSIYRTDLFSRAGSVSGSLWYPGFKEYVLSHTPVRRPDHVYFSLGEKERKTRNPVLRYVEQDTREICTFFKYNGISTELQLNPGGHHDHASGRTAAGLLWLLSR